MKILILGINGFIGNRLTENILSKTDWEIYGMDLSSHRLENCMRYSRLHFQQGDMTKEKDWIKKHLEICDVVLPLAAIASPSLYVKDPLRVFELDFEANLEIVKLVHAANKRLIFPSTSEVYGMCDEPAFDELTSKLILGPIEKERWIYSASKQLLDRVIYAYGKHRDLKFTLFRPFNWIGPKQDEVFSTEAEHSRVVSRFISNIIHNKDIILVNGGNQRRCFTYIDDGIDALMKIIENKDECANHRIFNIGNPENNITIRELAEKIKTLAMVYPKYHDLAEQTRIISVDEEQVYGKSYQDTENRVPSIKQAEKYLDWTPKTDIEIALNNTLDYYLS
ncbi:MAG: bifunctional UDP-4-keto-pentose/UDP-xylose synthase [Gammaproteobacteria bacterium]|nr:bifunctional UDP-4-keto-pentose/UDP-xylose synthase [Gammaproteobacteria bacterium]